MVGVYDSNVDSDHRMCVYDAAFCLRAPVGPIITTGMLQNQRLKDRAAAYYDTNGPAVMGELQSMANAEPDDIQRVICNFLTAPWRRMKPPGRRQDPFWTQELENLLREREACRRDYERYRTSPNRHRYQEAKNHFARRYRRSRKKKVKKWREELNDSQGREAQKRLSGIIKAMSWKDQRNSAGYSSVDPELMQEFLVSFRQDPITSDTLPAFAMEEDWQDNMTWSGIKEELADICQHLAARKAPGTSLVAQEMIRLCPDWCSEALLILLRSIAAHGRLPNQWGEAIVCPIEKTTTPTRPQDYRPICLLDVLRKACERVVARGLRSRVSYHASQSGFRTGVSTYNAICKVISAIHALGNSAVVVLLDLRKAYDLVCTTKLMVILEARIPEGFLLSMSKLLSRPPKIMVKGCAHFSQATTGVPQGSSLSPALFNLYMDTLLVRLEEAHASFGGRLPWCSSAFADDLALICQSATHAQSLLNECIDWGTDMDMQWSPSKCIVVARPSPKCELYLAGELLQHCGTGRYLGIDVCPKGVHAGPTLMKRCDSALKKARQMAKAGLASRYIKPSIRSKLYHIYLRPKLEYGLPFYDTHALTLLDSYACEAVGILLGPGYVGGTNWQKTMWLLDLPEWDTRQHYIRYSFVFKQVILPQDDDSDTIAFCASQLDWVATLCAESEELEEPSHAYERARVRDRQGLYTLRVRTHDDPDTDPRLPRLIRGQPLCLRSDWTNKDQRNAWQHLFYRFPPDPPSFRFYTLGKFGDAHLLDRWTATLLHTTEADEALSALHHIQAIVAEISPIYQEYHLRTRG